jgi:hypothetical protein
MTASKQPRSRPKIMPLVVSRSVSNSNNDTQRSEIRVTLVLHQPELDALKAISDGRSLSFMVRRAIAQFVVKKPRKRGKSSTVVD